KLGDRVRVVAGAPPERFTVPLDAQQRRAALALPDRYIVVCGTGETFEHGFRAAAAADIDVVVLDGAAGAEPRLGGRASAAGLPVRRAHVRGALSAEDRAAVLAGAAAFVATSDYAAWPWRAMEAMALGVPVVAVDCGSHRDVIAEGGALVEPDEVADAVVDAV